jgi:UDP-N-acetylglucosamine--dolichyl-phosphate N-acetylglucosaminephosphotransferase
MNSLIIPLVCALFSFLVVLYLTPWSIKYFRKIGLVVKDQNKKNKPLVPLSGGFPVLAGIFIGLNFYIFVRNFVYRDDSFLVFVFAGLSTLIMITLVGFIDDLLIKRSKESSSGLKQWQKPLLTLAAAIPLMVVNAGTNLVALPFFGSVNLGLVYPLILIPIGIVGAANMVNMLAGFNGLETGLGIIITASLGLYSFFNANTMGSLFALMTFSSLLAFYLFNKTPAKILPGDSLTYLIGGSIAIIAILGNIEKAAIIVSIPFFIEFFLKLRSNFKAHSYGYEKNGKIHSLHNKIYSIPHFFSITGKFTEKQIVYSIFLIQIIFALSIWIF